VLIESCGERGGAFELTAGCASSGVQEARASTQGRKRLEFIAIILHKLLVHPFASGVTEQ
jgi:hypothetical protein